VELFRKDKSKYYWYDFTVRGQRYRGSTKETNETRAQKAAALKLAAAIKGSDLLDRKPPTLREYAKDFLEWVETGRLESDTRRYYRNGCPSLRAIVHLRPAIGHTTGTLAAGEIRCLSRLRRGVIDRRLNARKKAVGSGFADLQKTTILENRGNRD